MRQLRGCRPARESGFGVRTIGGQQLDRGLARRVSRSLGEEDYAIARAAQPLDNGKFPVDNMALPAEMNQLSIHKRHGVRTNTSGNKASSTQQSCILRD